MDKIRVYGDAAIDFRDVSAVMLTNLTDLAEEGDVYEVLFENHKIHVTTEENLLHVFKRLNLPSNKVI